MDYKEKSQRNITPPRSVQDVRQKVLNKTTQQLKEHSPILSERRGRNFVPPIK